MMPEEILGNTTLKNADTGVQPKSCAASDKCLSVCRSFGSTDKMTYGKLNVICAINSVGNPRASFELTKLPTNTNKSIMETPVTISGFIIGILVTVKTALLTHFFFIVWIPTAAIVPSTTEMSEDEKRQKIDQLYLVQLKQAKAGLGLIKQLDEEINNNKGAQE